MTVKRIDITHAELRRRIEEVVTLVDNGAERRYFRVKVGRQFIDHGGTQPWGQSVRKEARDAIFNAITKEEK